MNATEKIIYAGTEHTIEVRPITLICHNTASGVEVPGRFKIGIEETLYHAERVKALHPDTKQWFETLLHQKISDSHIKEGTDADKIRGMGTGARHLMGLIEMCFNFTDMKIPFFVQYPEATLHPTIQVGLGDFFIYLTKRESDIIRGNKLRVQLGLPEWQPPTKQIDLDL